MADKLERDQLSRIKISGYKSIENCDLQLKKINILIGSNGAGKSNFISIFDMLRDLLAKNLALHVNKTGGANALLFKGRKYTKQISLEFFFGLNAYYLELIPTNDERLIFQRESFHYYANYIKKEEVSRGHSESLWEQGIGGYIDNYVKPILRNLKWRVYHFHDTSNEAPVKQSHNINTKHVLMSNASNLAAFLYRLSEYYRDSYDEIVQTVKLIAPYFDDFELMPNEGNEEKIILKWKQIGCEDIFSAAQFSDGTLRFICLATLLLQPKELQPATIIIDEPELGLHPYAITIFSELVQQASSSKQIIISTQSVELLNKFDVDDVIVVDRTKDGSTFSRLDEEELKEWLDHDYSLGDLWSKNILGGRLSK